VVGRFDEKKEILFFVFFLRVFVFSCFSWLHFMQ